MSCDVPPVDPLVKQEPGESDNSIATPTDAAASLKQKQMVDDALDALAPGGNVSMSDCTADAAARTRHGKQRKV